MRRLYDTRHSFASIMLSRGEEPMWVGCKMMGHKDLKCKSIGREPIAQPPGKNASALPNLASNGPITKNEVLLFQKL